MRQSNKTEERSESALSEQWPDIGFLGMGVWWGWIWLRYNGVNSLYDFQNANALSVFYSYIYSTLAIAAVVLIAAVFWKRATCLIDNTVVVVGFALVASIATFATGVSALVSSTALHCIASVFTGVGTAFLCLRTGRVYGRIPLGEALTNGSLSLLLAAALYFIGQGIPQEWHLLYASLLPLASAGLFALVRDESFASADASDVAPHIATAREHSMTRRLVLAASIVAFTAGVGKGITSLTIPVEQFKAEGVISVFFIGVAATVVLLLINRNSVYQGARYAYSALMVMGIALMLASCFGLSVSYLSIGKETLWFMFSCLMAYMAFRFEASSVRVFGIGQACYFACSAAGWLAGAALAPYYGDASVRMMCGVVLAFLVVLVTVYVFPEKSIKQIATWVPASPHWGNDETDNPIGCGDNSGEAARREPGAAEDVAPGGNALLEGAEIAPVPDDIAHRATDPRYGLSHRELEILRLFAQGRSANWIADSLVISKNTVRAHLRAIYTKLDVHSRQELLDFLNGKTA